MTGPTLPEKTRLLQALERYFKPAPTSVCIIRFLFEESIKNQRNKMSDKSITAQHIKEEWDINKEWPPKRSKDQTSNITSTMSKLYRRLNKFFQSEEGALHPWRITRPVSDGKTDRGNFVLWFERNVRPRDPGSPALRKRYPGAAAFRGRRDLVGAFWQPYIEGPQPVHILYPELRSIMDLRDGTYFRNENWDRTQLLKHFRLKDNDDIQLSYSFVSSGLVAGMLTILQYLSYYPDFRFEVRVIRPQEDIAVIPRSANCILFGTTTSTELLTILEGPAMQTENTGTVVHAGGRTRHHRDRFTRRGETMIQTKFGVLTRRRHPLPPVSPGNDPVAPGDSVITILAAKHGRAIEGMARFLTSPEWIRGFRRVLGRRGAFPQHFQSLFEVVLNKGRNGTPTVQEAKLLEFAAQRKPARGSMAGA
jgi:hypothetical protein